MGEKLDYIVQKFNLGKPNLYTINRAGEIMNLEKNKIISKDLIQKIINLNEDEATVLIEDKNKFF